MIPVSDYRTDKLMSDYERRRDTVKKTSFAIPCMEALNLLGRYGPLLEVGAGTGYWANLLRLRGVDIYPTEPVQVGNKYGFEKAYLPMEQLTGVEAVNRYRDRNLFMCWPSYLATWPYHTLKWFKRLSTMNHVIYIGEGRGGCCADYNFFHMLEYDFTVKEELDIPTWDYIHDSLTVYERKVLR